jgi:glutamate synthase domain-containing protein 2/glutamate synthase domain-containing protein 1/glutamate synthase domain-containing protein 3
MAVRDEPRSACGIGAVATKGGQPSRYPVEMALQALRTMEHRGGTMPDGTGDGAGLMVTVPQAFFERHLAALAGAGRRMRPTMADCAVGVFFLPVDEPAAAAARQTAERVLRLLGLAVLAWRPVPVRPEVLTDRARGAMPRIEHLIIALGHVLPADRARTLFRARKAIEHALNADHRAYIASLSHRTMVYKALLTGPELAEFYPDLADESFLTTGAVFHRRYSTNTFPDWGLAQPLRLVAHNGEFNTILGNRAAVAGFEAYLREHAAQVPWEGSLLQPGASDSADFDAALEAYAAEGRSLPYTLAALKPPAWEERVRHISPELRAFFEWHKRAMGTLGSWDGPAALAAFDGDLLCIALDRMGLRPLRYALDGAGTFYAMSEVGGFGLPAQDLRVRVQLEPGNLVVFRLADGAVAADVEVYQAVLEEARAALKGSFRDLNRSCLLSPTRFGLYRTADLADLRLFGGVLDRFLRAHGWESAPRREAVAAMLERGKEPVGSLGFDRALSAMSVESLTLYKFLQQRFAEVTNPPVDPYREGRAMSLVTYLGARPDTPPRVSRPTAGLRLASPIITDRVVDELLEHPRLKSVRLRLAFGQTSPGPAASFPSPAARRPGEPKAAPAPRAPGLGDALTAALDDLAERAVAAVRDGAEILVLSDLNVLADGAQHGNCPPEADSGLGLGPEHGVRPRRKDIKGSDPIFRPKAQGALPVPPLLAVGAVHRRLRGAGLRPLASIVVQAADVQEAHDIACLLAVGADAVNPYALFAVMLDDAAARNLPVDRALKQLLAALNDGLGRILSKLGITTVQGYIDSGLFEAVGLGPDVLAACPHVASRVGGLTLDDVAADVARRVERARSLVELPRTTRDARAFEPRVRRALWDAANASDPTAYDAFSRLISERPPICLRDLLEIAPSAASTAALPADDVTAAEVLIRERFVAAAMSRGALTGEAHETLARAANRIGMRSNSGEGGEEESRNPGGHNAAARSRIRQVASGRFGVDAVYLLGADEIQIKMAQGAKPGEGGQLLHAKVTPAIAALRCCRPGIDLISPPPHHDIYSIEDFAQLIRDLRALHPIAVVSVKLVSVTGVGTIGVGVVKAGAEVIELDGCDGGTGASPRSSIEHAGLPVELGLAELHAALVANGLRERVRLRATGGLKNEEDVLKLALLGADEFAFATALMVAMGCLHCGECHTGRCPARIAGEGHPKGEFRGGEERIITFVQSLAEALRRRLAHLGARDLGDLVGHAERLRPISPDALRARLAPYGDDAEYLAARLARFDLSCLTTPAPLHDARPSAVEFTRRDDARQARRLNEEMERDADLLAALESRTPVERRYAATNSNSLDFAAPVVRRLALKYGRAGWPGPDPLVRFVTEGRGGQSFGAWLVPGIDIRHHGSVNDGIAKGMSGGRIVVRSTGALIPGLFENGLVGSNAAYGATGGVLYVQGAAGQRLGVRNSGATIVVEGAGKYPCEYMTGGVVVCLGDVGEELGAGMTDGVVYVYDPDDSQDLRYKVHEDSAAVKECDEDELYLRLVPILTDYLAATESARAREALSNLGAFWKVIPLVQNVEETTRRAALASGRSISG